MGKGGRRRQRASGEGKGEGERGWGKDRGSRVERGLLSNLPFFFFFSFFFFSFLATQWHMEFLSQGSDPSHSCCYAAVVATLDPLTHCSNFQMVCWARD